jgi:YesN/AraC family two-component response regulator
MNCYAVNFNLKNLKDQPARLPFPLVSHIGKRAELIRLFQELNVIWLDSRPFYRGNAQALFLLILHRLFELIVYNTNLADFRVQKTIHHIAVHYGEKITVKQMAKMFDLNPLYFGRLFRQETGMTINRHLIKTRIKNAEIMLRNGEYNVEKTAKNCGYNDISCFYKQFKRICGISPAECIPKKDL